MKASSTSTSPRIRRSTVGRRAFTLIELLVVIAIIALLAALIVPMASNSIQKAKRAACMSNLRQIGLGIVLFKVDHKDRLPTRGGPSVDSFWMWDGAPTYLGHLYEVYLQDFKVFFCPGQDIRADYFRRYGMKQFTDQKWGKENILSTYVQRGEFPLAEEQRAVAACSRHGNSLIPHAGDGPNVLYLDGGVRWLSWNEDNNYRPYAPSTIDFWKAADLN